MTSIAIILIAILFPVANQTFQTEAPQECKNTELGGSLFYQNKPIAGSISTNESFSVDFANNVSNHAILSIEYNDLKNDTIVVEDSDSDGQNELIYASYQSFVVEQDASLLNLSAYLRDGADGDDVFYFYLINSYWNGTHSVPIGFANNSNKIAQLTPNLGSYNAGWVTIQCYISLDTSLTDNNTFFIAIQDSSGDGTWCYDNNDGTNDGYAYNNAFNEIDADFLLKAGVSYQYTFLINDTLIEKSDVYEFTYNATTSVYFDLDYSSDELIDIDYIIYAYAIDEEFRQFDYLDVVNITITIPAAYRNCVLFLNITNITNTDCLESFELLVNNVANESYMPNDLLVISLNNASSIALTIYTYINESFSVDFRIIANFRCCNERIAKLLGIYQLIPVVIALAIVVYFAYSLRQKED